VKAVKTGALMFKTYLQQREELPDPRSEEFVDRLSAALQDQNILDDLAVRRARKAAAQSHERFDLVLTRLGLVTDAALAGVLSKLTAIPLAKRLSGNPAVCRQVATGVPQGQPASAADGWRRSGRGGNR
jgi:hypothetical protein